MKNEEWAGTVAILGDSGKLRSKKGGEDAAPPKHEYPDRCPVHKRLSGSRA